MKNLQKILIPIDFSNVAKNAVQYANVLLQKQSAEAVLIYINRDDNPKNEIEILKDFSAFENDTLLDVTFQYQFHIGVGNLLAALIKASNNLEPACIIVGTKGNRKADLSLVSSLIRSVDFPVIVVPENYKNHQVRKIAFANDYKPIQASEAIKPLWKFALEFRAKVDLLHINYKKKEILLPEDASEKTLDYYLQSQEHKYVYISSDDVELAINEYIRENNIDLLVILSRDHGKNKLKSEGRLISQLTAHAQVPILALC